MQGERSLIRSREHIFSRYLWIKLVFSVGLYFFWWRSNVLELTDRRVVLRSGVLSKNERSVPLAKVQDVTVSRGRLGGCLGLVICGLSRRVGSIRRSQWSSFGRWSGLSKRFCGWWGRR